MAAELTQESLERKVIVFRLENEEYGVDVSQVRSIERMQKVTRVPRTASFVQGVINLRGVVTPILDLRERFGLEQEENTENTRIIIVAVDAMEVGLIVDAANDVVDIQESMIEQPPSVVGGVQAVYLSGVAKLADRLLILLNLAKVLSPEEIQQLSHMEH